MTNKERKAFQNFMNQMNAYSREVDEHREALTNMCRENGLPTYSNPRSCRDMLLTSDDATIRYLANYEYDQYVKACGAVNLLDKYGAMLADLNFWK